MGEPLYAQPPPEASATGDDIGYLGHDVWVGPQKAWWTQQDVNRERREAKANWPPDPFLAFGKTRVIESTPTRLVLEGIESPVSGVRFSKTYALSDERADTVEVSVTARNIRCLYTHLDVYKRQGLPVGMPGMGEVMDGAMQQAPQPGRQEKIVSTMSHLSLIHI